jgi:hypothetical protein
MDVTIPGGLLFVCRRNSCGDEQRAGAREQRGSAADDNHQPAMRFQSARRPDHLFLGSRHHRS